MGEFCYNFYMKRSIVLLLFIGLTCLLRAQTTPAGQSAADTARTVTKSSLTATRMDSKLNDVILHRTVMDYTLPEELRPIMQKCVEGESDECYFSLKTFENASDSNLAGAANLELAYLSLQRGLLKQAMTYVDRAQQLRPDDPFIQLSQGWFLLALFL